MYTFMYLRPAKVDIFLKKPQQFVDFPNEKFFVTSFFVLMRFVGNDTKRVEQESSTRDGFFTRFRRVFTLLSGEMI